MAANADRRLLFGMLALQNGIINQGQLVHAFQAWTIDNSKSLALHLEARGDLTGPKRALMEGLAEIHLEAHGDDVEKSLAAVPATTAPSPVRGGEGHATAFGHGNQPRLSATPPRPVASGRDDQRRHTLRTGDQGPPCRITAYNVQISDPGDRQRVLQKHRNHCE